MIKLRLGYLGIVFLYFCLGAHPEIGADATLLSMMDRGVSSSTPLVKVPAGLTTLSFSPAPVWSIMCNSPSSTRLVHGATWR